MRTFIALELPEETHNYINKITDNLMQMVNGKRIPEFNLHITLAFLGDISYADTEIVNGIMREAVQNVHPIDISLQKFILLQKGNVAALEIKLNKPLKELQQNISNRLMEEGLLTETRAFRPHITIMRNISYEMPYREICKRIQIFNRPHPADKLTLYMSTLGGENPVYDVLNRLELL